ncbi:MAG: cache domain-containing protein [Campylobacterales bacterium]|nr:cache domain-containing protein [Campylobacterales bacterium]
MLLTEKNITRLIAYGPFIFIPSVVIMLTLMVINTHLSIYKKNVQSIEIGLQNSEKKAIQSKVDGVVDLVAYQNSIIKEKLLLRVKSRVDNAYETAAALYEKYKDKKTPQELQELIITALRPLVWNDGESFIFILDYEGMFRLAPKYLSHLEGSSIINFQDALGRFVIQEEIAMCKNNQEGFLKDTFTKPNDASCKFHEQVAYVKAFGHYNWYLGSSEYLETASKKSDEELLQTIGKINTENDNYFFVMNSKGDVLLHKQKSALVGHNLLENEDIDIQMAGRVIQGALEIENRAFISYEWMNDATHKKETKHSYIHAVKESDWIIESGFYDSTLKKIADIKAQELYSNYLKEFENILFIAFVIIIISLIISYLISRFIKKSFNEYKKEINTKSLKLLKLNDTLEETVKVRTQQLHEQKNILYHQANHDSLTTLPNRALFTDRLTQGTLKAKRYQKKLALLFIDLDRFKIINDTLGHDIGDAVLKETAKRLASIVRDEDTVSRLGGDEFTIIMQELIHEEDASILAQKVINALVEPIVVNEHILYISSSIGISLYPKDATEVEDLLRHSDAAMYKAKEKGRNNFQFYSM